MAAAKGGNAAKSSGTSAKQTIKPQAKGQKPITFAKGGLHKSLGVPAGKPIPAGKMAAAQHGDFGPKAQKQANFAVNVLGQGQKTAAKNRTKGTSRGRRSK